MIFFIYIVLPTVVGRCCMHLANIVDLARLAKPLLASPIQFYIYYIKEALYFLNHDKSYDVLAVSVNLAIVEEEYHMQHNGRCKTHRFRSRHAVSS